MTLFVNIPVSFPCYSTQLESDSVPDLHRRLWILPDWDASGASTKNKSNELLCNHVMPSRYIILIKRKCNHPKWCVKIHKIPIYLDVLLDQHSIDEMYHHYIAYTYITLHYRIHNFSILLQSLPDIAVGIRKIKAHTQQNV